MPTLRTRFGKRLRTLHRERDFTQERFAELAEVSVDFLSLVERGINGPSFDTLDGMVKALRIPRQGSFRFCGKEAAKSSRVTLGTQALGPPGPPSRCPLLPLRLILGRLWHRYAPTHGSGSLPHVSYCVPLRRLVTLGPLLIPG